MKKTLTFRGGIHPLSHLGEGKIFTENCPIEYMPAPAIARIPCVQHIGSPAAPVVSVGDHVTVGQLIAKAQGFVSSNIHSGISGTVTAIETKPDKLGRQVSYIVVENDGKDELSPEIAPPKPLESLSSEEILSLIAETGMVGMGGAGFPAQVKLTVPEEKHIDTILLNGAECEPFLTSDYRLMLEHPDVIIFGLKALKKVLSVPNVFIGIEDNKPKAIQAFQEILPSDFKLFTLKTKYPQGCEKQLIEAVSGRMIPRGRLPIDVGIVSLNAASLYAIGTMLLTGMPLIERVVTVSGNIATPKNLMVRIGTPLEEVIAYCGGVKEGSSRLILGGPMMGLSIPNTNYSITKTDGGILALSKEDTTVKLPSNCIRCGACATACPLHLQPFIISLASEQGDYEKAEKYGALDCMSCGSCTFTCPAKRHIAQSIRVAKDEISLRRRKLKK